ncbi:MAG: MFS transporter [Syntrophaceae bacterium]|nr:MFS transporter [Syntrophaceae bacterium]
MPKILTRDFLLVFLAQFTFTFVFHILIPTLPIYLSRLGSTEEEIGVLIGIFFFSSLVLRPFVGKALLKTQEKNFMIAGALLFAFTSVAYLFAPPFWPVLIVRIFQGIGFAFFQTASLTLIVNISSEAHRGRSVSYFYLAINLSGALGPSLGMFLINHFSFSILFWVCLGLSLGSLFITHRLGLRTIIPLPDVPSEDHSLISRKAIPTSIVSSLSLFIWGALTAFFPLFAIDQGVSNPGLFFTTMAIMLILGRALGGKLLDLYSKERIILPCLATYIISMVILAFSKTLPMFILTAVIWGIGHAFLIPSVLVSTLERVGTSPGPAMGTFTAITDLGVSLGPMITGIIVHNAGYPIMFLCLALTGVINLCYFYFFVRKKE